MPVLDGRDRSPHEWTQQKNGKLRGSHCAMEPARGGPSFWGQVKQEAIAGLIVAASVAVCGGIIYLVYTVPSQLDQVLRNQSDFKETIQRHNEQLAEHDRRIIKLELAK